MGKVLNIWSLHQYKSETIPIKGKTPIDKCIYYSELLDKCKIENHNKIQQNKNCTFYIERFTALKCNKSDRKSGNPNVKKGFNYKEDIFE